MLKEVFTHAFRVAHPGIFGVNLAAVIALQRPAAFSSGLYLP